VNASEIRENDVIRLTPDGPACRVYRDRTRSKDTVDHLEVDGTAMVRFSVGATVVTVPADREVEVVARHGNHRTVSLTKAWYLGLPIVGSVVTCRQVPGVFRVVDIDGDGYQLAPFKGGPAVHFARVGELTLVRSHAVESIRAAKTAPQPQKQAEDLPDIAVAVGCEQSALWGGSDAA
jgi:hypothetical protein